MRYFDSHTHVHFAAYKDDSDAVIRRAIASGVGMLTVGTQRDTSRGAVETARKYPGGVWAAIGLHPVHTDKSFHDAEELGGGEEAKGFTSRGEEFDYGYYLELGKNPEVVAVGECGLDYYRMERGTESVEQKAKQKKAFEAQIQLAHELKKPLMIHCRAAFPDLISMLSAYRSKLLPNPGVVHFFTGTPADAESLLELGFAFTFGGVVTFARAYDETINFLPSDRILSETDAPYVAPVPYRGKRNEPAYVMEVVKKLAEIKGISGEKMASQIWKNAADIFKI